MRGRAERGERVRESAAYDGVPPSVPSAAPISAIALSRTATTRSISERVMMSGGESVIVLPEVPAAAGAADDDAVLPREVHDALEHPWWRLCSCRLSSWR